MRTKEGLDDAAGVAVVFDEDDEDEALSPCLYLTRPTSKRCLLFFPREPTTSTSSEMTTMMTTTTRAAKWTMTGRPGQRALFGCELVPAPSNRDDRGIHATLLEADDEEDRRRYPAVLLLDRLLEVVGTSQEEAKKEDKYNVDIQKIDAHWPALP